MSVDIFGRALKKKKNEAARGPPGVGYKLTSDGQFDTEDRRLCNLAAPLEPNDAVNLQTLKNFVSSELQSLDELTKRLKSDLDTLNLLIDSYRLEIDVKVLQKFADLVDHHRELLKTEYTTINNYDGNEK